PIRSKISPNPLQPSFRRAASSQPEFSLRSLLYRICHDRHSQFPQAKPPNLDSRKSRLFSARGLSADKRVLPLRSRATCPAQRSNKARSIPAPDPLREQFELPAPNHPQASSAQICPQVFANRLLPQARQSYERPTSAFLSVPVSAKTRSTVP